MELSDSHYDTLPIPILMSFPFPTHHSKAHVSSFQCRAIVGSITCYRDNLPVGANSGLDDMVHQSVLVSWRGSGEHTQLGPDLITFVLGYLEEGREGEGEGGGRGRGCSSNALI